MAESEARKIPPKRWPGTNWLGESLMRVRARLRHEAAAGGAGVLVGAASAPPAARRLHACRGSE